MVFESLVVDLFNKYFSDIVENLDRSQLKVGIWKGNVKLHNLDLKESALNDLNRAVKIKTGHIEKLTLKIPWKNLYREPVFVSIDGFYVLAVPNVAIRYNAEKEENDKQESKQRKLLQIEESKKAAAEKGKEEGRKDSFLEEIVAMIIKNLEIQIKNIHFRYEDCHTNPNHPFSIGVNLAELLFQTSPDTVTPDLKRVKIDSLAVYWNNSSEQYASLSKERLLERLGKEIAGKNNNIAYQFLLKPVTSSAQLKLNMKPKPNNFTLPKVFLKVMFDDISIELSKEQYNDVLIMLESFERMHLMSVYRKYRPEVPLHGHAKTWWHFARDCVLEEKVRHRRRMFSWNHIIHHRNVMKRYKEAYSIMLSNPKKVPRNVQNDIEECERFLDVFSITLVRSEADVKIAKCDEKKLSKPMAWLRRLFKRKKKKREKDIEYIKEKFEQEFTAEEKAKLYEAIGYQENEVDPALPREASFVIFIKCLSDLKADVCTPANVFGMLSLSLLSI